MLTTAEMSDILLREVENATAELDDSRLELVFTTAFQNNPDFTEILNRAINAPERRAGGSPGSCETIFPVHRLWHYSPRPESPVEERAGFVSSLT